MKTYPRYFVSGPNGWSPEKRPNDSKMNIYVRIDIPGGMGIIINRDGSSYFRPYRGEDECEERLLSGYFIEVPEAEAVLIS